MRFDHLRPAVSAREKPLAVGKLEEWDCTPNDLAMLARVYGTLQMSELPSEPSPAGEGPRGQILPRSTTAPRQETSEESSEGHDSVEVRGEDGGGDGGLIRGLLVWLTCFFIDVRNFTLKPHTLRA